MSTHAGVCVAYVFTHVPARAHAYACAHACYGCSSVSARAGPSPTQSEFEVPGRACL